MEVLLIANLICIIALIVLVFYKSVLLRVRREQQAEEFRIEISTIHQKQKALNEKLIVNCNNTNGAKSEIRELNNKVLRLHKKFIKVYVK
jgi:hypothetical protein